jgi:hypothetical protein
LQQHQFTGDFHVLSVAGHDVILGMDWLHLHNPSTLDSRLGRFTVHLKDKNVHLQLKPITAALHLYEQAPDINKHLHQGADILVAQLLSVTAQSEQQDHCLPLPVQQILFQFHDIFSPSILPPRRSCDHQIHLVPNSKTF